MTKRFENESACLWSRRPLPFGSVVAALIAIILADIYFLSNFAACAHWFIIPISICGFIVGIDAVNWLRGGLDLYDPFGIMGVLGVHYFFIAPLLHVSWDMWTVPDATPADWRDWLGYMGILNTAGLILYVWLRSSVRSRHDTAPTLWRIKPRRMRVVFPLFIGISALAQAAVYARYGGISGYIETRFSDPNAMTGMGPVFLVSESAPILIAWFLILKARGTRASWTSISLGLLALFVMEMYFGGLRGSRSETIELFFWVIGCVHFMVRPVPRSFVALGVVFFAVFMYLYGFYKALGADATQALTGSSEDRAYIAEQKHRTTSTLVLGDLARADVQAFILFRLVQDGRDYEYGYGRSYLGALALLVPKSILPDRPHTKLKLGTELQTGNVYDPENPSSRVYGLAGEGMLNFGPLAVPVLYGLFGYVVARFQRFVVRLNRDDARLMLAPIGVYMCVGIMTGDSDNFVFGLAKNVGLPFIVLALSSLKLRRAALGPRFGVVTLEESELA